MFDTNTEKITFPVVSFFFILLNNFFYEVFFQVVIKPITQK